MSKIKDSVIRWALRYNESITEEVYDLLIAHLKGLGYTLTSDSFYAGSKFGLSYESFADQEVLRVDFHAEAGKKSASFMHVDNHISNCKEYSLAELYSLPKVGERVINYEIW